MRRSLVFVLCVVAFALVRANDARCDDDGPTFPGASLLAPTLAARLDFDPIQTDDSSFDPALSSASTTPDYDFSPTTSATQSDLSKAFASAPIYRGTLVSDLKIAPARKRVFGYAIGARGAQEYENAAIDKPGFDATLWSGTLGTDWNLFQHCAWGYGLQGGRIEIDPKRGGRYDQRVNSFSGNLHLSVFDSLWRVDLLLGMGKNWVKQKQFSAGIVNSYSTSQWIVATEFGARFDKGYTRIEPLIGFRVLNLNEPRRAEGLMATTTYATDFADASYRLRLGSRFSWEYDATLATLKPYIEATWAHEFGRREIYTLGEGTPFPIAYRYAGHKLPRDRFDLGGGLDAALRDTMDAYLKYDVEFAHNYVDYLLQLGINKKF